VTSSVAVFEAATSVKST